MTTIVLDGLNEEDFRRSIENRLREGSAGAAISRLRALIAPYARPGGMLPERFLTVAPHDLKLSGWEALGESVLRHDKPGRPITAISIAFGWPGDDVTVPDAEGRLRPHVETSYFNDSAYPFSQSAREDLLEGYSFYGCTWSGDSEATDNALTLQGIDDLHGALALLEARLLTSDEPDEESIRAGSLGACLLSALLVQAVTERINRNDLPRPLCVMAGSSGVYPYFDAPVAGMPEEARKAAELAEETGAAELGAPAPRYSSLLMTGIPRAKKRAVLVLDESSDEMNNRIAKLRGLSSAEIEAAQPLYEAAPEVDAFEMPELAAAAGDNGPLLVKKPHREDRDLHEILGLSTTGFAHSETPIHDAAEAADTVDDWDDWGEPAIQAEQAQPENRDEPQSIAGPAEPVETNDWDEPVNWPEPAEPAEAIRHNEPVDRFELVDWPVPDEQTKAAEPSDWAEWPKPADQSDPVDWPEREQPAPLPDSEPAAAPGFTLLDANLQQRLQFFLSAEALPIAKASPSVTPIVADLAAPVALEESRAEEPAEVAPDDLVAGLSQTEPRKSLAARLQNGISSLLSRFSRES